MLFRPDLEMVLGASASGRPSFTSIRKKAQGGGNLLMHMGMGEKNLVLHLYSLNGIRVFSAPPKSR